MKANERMERLKSITGSVRSVTDAYNSLYDSFVDMCSNMIELNSTVSSNLMELAKDNVKLMNRENSQEEADYPSIRMKCSCGHEWNVTELDDFNNVEFAKCSCCGASVDADQWNQIVTLFGAYGDMVRELVKDYMGYSDKPRLITFSLLSGNTEQFLNDGEQEED